MANYRILTLAVVIIALLGSALITPLPVRADQGLPGNCTFQNPIANDSPLADSLWMDPRWPNHYDKDGSYPGLHFADRQWAGLDIESPMRLPFQDGGTVIFVGDSYDSAGGGWGVVYAGAGNCTGWITAYWHNPSQVGYTMGQTLDRTTPAGTPGCSGFEAACGTGQNQIHPHLHWNLGYQGDTNPFPSDIPAYQTVSPNPAIGSVWWINGLRVVPSGNMTVDEAVGVMAGTITSLPTVPVFLTLVCAATLILGLSNRKTRGAFALGTLVILVSGVAWLALHTKIEKPSFVLAAEPTALPTAQPTAASPDTSLSQRGAANQTGWLIIKQAVADAGGSPAQAEILYWTWQSETAVVDCLPWKVVYEQNGQKNPCVSKVFAKGPFQFMDGTWERYADRGWDKWTLYGASRAAYEEFTRLSLWDHATAVSFAKRFSGVDGGQVWNKGADGYNQALVVFNNWSQMDPP